MMVTEADAVRGRLADRTIAPGTAVAVCLLT